MILADAGIWLEYFRAGEPRLKKLLEQGQVWMHDGVRGELFTHALQPRSVNYEIARLPRITMAREMEVLYFIQVHELWGQGIGYPECHLLASAQISERTRLWTANRRLHRVAARLGLAAEL